jgi:TFIIF-interacting CTD phosphatase-like protein
MLIGFLITLIDKKLLNIDYIDSTQLLMKIMQCKDNLINNYYTNYSKDLRNLGRPLEKTIIIDNLAENFNHTTPENGIWVESWYDDMEDTVLELLLPFLKEIVTGKVPDVR